MKKRKQAIALMISITMLAGIYMPVRAEGSNEEQIVQNISDVIEKELQAPSQIGIADDGVTTQSDFTYTVDANNEVTITGYTGNDSHMVVPSTIGGKKVVKIGVDAFKLNKTFSSVDLPSTVKELGRCSFAGCDNLREIEIPDSVELVGTSSFEACHSLLKATVYSNTILEDSTFGNEVFTGYPTTFRVYCYEGSSAEKYCTKWDIPFVYNDRIPLTGITLPDEITVNLNQRTEISVTYLPADSYVGFHVLDNRKFVGEGAATFEVDKNGRLYITPTEVGQNELSFAKYAVYNYIDKNITSNICKVNIVDPSKINATSLTITDKDGNILSNTKKIIDTVNGAVTMEMKEVMTPSNANEAITFTSSDPYSVSVKQTNGVWTITASKYYESETTITATSSRTGQSSSFIVKSVFTGVKSLKFDTTKIKMREDAAYLVNKGTYSMPITLNPSSFMNQVTIDISDPSVLTYDKITGKIIPLKAGTATITASAGDKSCSQDFEVGEYELHASSVSITTDDRIKSSGSNYTLSLNLGDTYKISSSVAPVDTTDIKKWHYDKNFISMAEDGTLKALKEGTTTMDSYTVSCVDANSMFAKSGTLTITITDPNKVVEPEKPEVILAKDMTFNQSDCQMNLGDTIQLSTSLTPANTTEKPTYSSNNISVATVSDTGLVTIVGYGTVGIAAKIRGLIDVITITVAVPVIHPVFTINNTSLTMEEGTSHALVGNVTANTNVTPISWSTNNINVATVSNTGVVQAKKAGTTRIQGVIYCYDTTSLYFVYCDVTVAGGTANPTQVSVQRVDLSHAFLNLDYGNTGTLNASLYPLESQGTVAWSSDNVNVATVNNGVVTAKGAGSCVISAYCAGQTTNCTVTVAKGEIKLNASKFNLQKGKTTKALTISSSTYDNDRIISVTSSNSSILKASVSNNQIVLKGAKTSSKYITVTVTTESGATQTCQVKVVKDKVTTSKLTLNKKSTSLAKGEKESLTVTQTPISSTDKLTWSSSNKKVVSVDKNGNITAKKKGKATITLKSSNGKKVTCKVTVK